MKINTISNILFIIYHLCESLEVCTFIGAGLSTLSNKVIFKEVSPSGYIQCVKECKLSANCADIVYNKDTLYCGLVRDPAGTVMTTDITSGLFGSCESHSCALNEKCVLLRDTTNVCIGAVSCPNEWTYYDEKCYWVSSASATDWYNARDLCVTMRGSLATIESDAVSNLLSALTQSGVFWVGGNDIEVEGTWTWVENGNNMQYSSKWSPTAFSDPIGNDCLGITDSGVWYDVSCTLPAHYICQTSLTH